MKLLEKIKDDYPLIKDLSIEQLNQLCEEIREFIIEVVSKNGGHLSSNLGTVEITVALHKVFNIPPDKIIWDVGHQSYTHKILTRYEKFETLRKYGGISGFPNPGESETDIFLVGHAGTGISSATGIKIGNDFKEKKEQIIAVIGDGSLTNGITFEGLNFLGDIKKNVKIILNDNKMSISPTKGALSYYLTKFISSPLINKPKEEFVEILKKIPALGDDILKITKELEKKTKFLIVPGVFFEKLGIRYFGPIDGHDIEKLIEILENIKEINEPVVLHVITKKGKGYSFAESDPEKFHSIGPFDIKTGNITGTQKTNSKFVGEILEKLAEKNNFFVITAAMEKGLGLENFARNYQDRFFDVGIAESNAVIIASGIAKSGMNVFVAIYSTFLQRTYDQIFHDICLQNLPVIFLVDRAGIVGEDGPTHHGIFDISFLRTIPNLKIYAPYSLETLKETIENSIYQKMPTFIRYPRDILPETINEEINEGSSVVILAVGSMALNSYFAFEKLKKEKIILSFIPVNQIKPVDEVLMKKIEKFDKIITVEENITSGGFGSYLLEIFSDRNIKKYIFRIGLPETFIEHGDRNLLLDKYGLSVEKIYEKIREFLNV
ncbi:MAG TPA: 1-deoxy-D-xylulose-5-phosphate synthase [bacterium]|nr:1-deoxy-D-xylulose-5-phosphate synthase [bacterium]HOM26150.1 1-deoxy-D-xylulose-5-phosphate synthase [bacterium]